ncbi:MAG: hypothetical protein ABL993_05970 [Vicinamibacterales bacterium]
MSLRLKAFALAAALTLVPGHSDAQAPTLRTAMREKLANAQQLLEAVVRADFPAISRSADRLSRINDVEIASWQAVAQPAYTEQASRFLLSVQKLREAAANGNSQAATDEYAILVSSCVRCHQYVRNSRMVSQTPGRPAPAASRPVR